MTDVRLLAMEKLFYKWIASRGYLSLLKWAHKQKYLWDGSTCAYAARAGHLDVLQWARLQGCPWDKYTSIEAALNGHLEVLKWAYEQGCSWNKRSICAHAAKSGNLQMLR